MAKSNRYKSQLCMAGEFGVCAELSKRGHDVSLTMGNYKAVDIFVFLHDSNETVAKRIEVKTSRSTRFVTGFFQKYYDKSLSNHPDYWVLVYIDPNNISHYYILTHEEMGNVQMARNKMTTWERINGCDNVLLKDIKAYEDLWNKIF